VQSLNEEVTSFKEAVATGESPFPPSLSQIEHSKGVLLLMRKADRDFYLNSGTISFGMYLGILREEIS